MFFFLQSCEKKKTNVPKIKSHSSEILKIKDIADNYLNLNNYDSSFYYYNKLEKVSEMQNDTSAIINSLNGMARNQTLMGDYSGSESTLIKALPLVENTNKYPIGKADLFHLLGSNSFLSHNYKQALYYYNQSKCSNNNVLENAYFENDIALVHMKMGKYQKAKEILLALLSKKEIINNPFIYSRILDNLGSSYFKTGDYIKSTILSNRSLKIKRKENDKIGIVASYLNLAEYNKEKNLKLANHYALLAYKTSTLLNVPDDRLEVLRFLIKNNSGNKSKEYALIYLNLNDSIQKVRQKAKNQFAKIKYDFKKEKEENEILKTQRALEQEQQKNKTLLFYFVISIGLITTLFIYYYLITKNKKEKIKVSYNTEVRIAKKLHDELANDVYHTMAFAETQDLSTNTNKEKLLHNLDTIYTRTRNISKENSAINTDSLFLPNLKEMMLGFSTDKVNVLTNGMETIHWEKIETLKKITLYRVLQELLVNMKKHSNCSLVILTFKENENQLEINYTDNGIGVTQEQLKSKNGLKNVENRILAIKGNCIFDTKSNTGFRVNIRFPI
jgi:signal transduction histidine kinase